MDSYMYKQKQWEKKWFTSLTFETHTRPEVAFVLVLLPSNNILIGHTPFANGKTILSKKYFLLSFESRLFTLPPQLGMVIRLFVFNFLDLTMFSLRCTTPLEQTCDSIVQFYRLRPLRKKSWNHPWFESLKLKCDWKPEHLNVSVCVCFKGLWRHWHHAGGVCQWPVDL